MQKYLVGFVALLGGLLVMGAGCSFNNKTQTDKNTDTSEKQAGVMTDKKSDDTMMENNNEENTMMVPVNTVIFDLTGKNFEFSEKELRIKEGQTVTINFESTQGFHDWVIDEFDAHTKQVNPGEPTSVTFVANKTGEYEYYCSVGKHRDMGMKGILVVEPAVQEMVIENADAMTTNDEMMEEKNIEDSMMEKNTMMEESTKGEGYIAYDPAKLALANSGDVVLFFHASWCPTCKVLNSALETSTFPDDLTVMKVDYDNSSELKKKYGITSQHTLVHVDAQGTMKDKWLGGSSLADIQSHLK